MFLLAVVRAAKCPLSPCSPQRFLRTAAFMATFPFALFPAINAVAAERMHAGQLVVQEQAVPAHQGSRYPFITTGADKQIYLCWLEPGAGKEFRLRFSAYENQAFQSARTITKGNNLFVNWADFPSVMALANGTLAAHWLVRNGKGTYAYGVRAACSLDGGKNWNKSFWLHDDQSPTEHGFVSLVAQGNKEFLAIWLDARNMEKSGNTELYARSFDADGKLGEERRLDHRVCSCCQPSIARSGARILSVYRDRDAAGIRDISIVSWEDRRWTAPRPCHHDGWKIPG